MCAPDAVNGASLEAQFPTNPMTKRSLVVSAQVSEGITENQHKSSES
jgi:hypothetical protein